MRISFFICAAHLATLAAGGRLEAQCSAPPGAYEMLVSPALVEACPGAPVTIEVHAGPGGPPISGFGFNLVFGGPGAVASVTPGYATDPGGAFVSAVGPDGSSAACLGIAPPAVAPITLLATVVFIPEATAEPGSWSVAFGGTLALPSGIVPEDHLVEMTTGCDLAAPLLSLTGGTIDVAPCGATFVRGDANGDGGIDLTDAVSLLGCLFLGGVCPVCEDAADANDTGSVDISDAIFDLTYLFLGGLAPPPPSPSGAGYTGADCGPDPTPDGLTCITFAPCE